MIKDKVKKSINLKLSLWIGFSLVLSVAVYMLSFEIIKTKEFINIKHVDYDEDRYNTDKIALDFINGLYTKDIDTDKYINEKLSYLEGQVYIVNEEGNVIYGKSTNSYEVIEKINIDIFKEEMNYCKPEEYKKIYPITINGKLNYFIMIKNLKDRNIYTHEVSYIISGIISLSLFIFLIYRAIRKKVKYLEYISSSIEDISKGNLNVELKTESEDELAVIANQINIMEKNILNMIEKEKESDKLQRELITNISHDLKTPLTIILGYLDIIRTKAIKSEDERDEYIEKSYEKALVLQNMILKLFELVKLNNNKEVLNKSEVNINKLLKQVITELLPIAKENEVNIYLEEHKENILLNVDLDKICRVFNNLLGNAIKYSEDKEDIKIFIKDDEAGALITFKNKCTTMNKEELNNIFRRFYRSDKARNSAIEGSGVGLSIVKRILELHNSNIWVELDNGYIFFNVRLRG